MYVCMCDDMQLLLQIYFYMTTLPNLEIGT